MRLTQKKKEQILVGFLGEGGLPLIRKLTESQNISEFYLAKQIKKDIKIVRKMLYILYNHNLVGFTRKKDKEKGWYIYYWTLIPESIRFVYFKMKHELLEKLTKELEEEKEELFFSCPERCVRLNFDQAMDFEFHCPECGALINQDNTQKRVAVLKKKIEQIENELKKIKEPIKAPRKTLEKKIAKKKKVKNKKAAKTKQKPAKQSKTKCKKKKTLKKGITKKKKKSTHARTGKKK